VPNARKEENSNVLRAFEEPEWYLTRFATNIRLRSETLSTMLNLPTPSALSVLDIGCGDGSLSLPLLKRGCNVTFLDRSDAMLQIVATRVPAKQQSHATLLRADFLDARIPRDSLDVVICVGVLAYIVDLESFLAKLADVIKPGGQLIFECTDAPHLMSRLSRGYNWIAGLFKPRPFVPVKWAKRQVISTICSSGFSFIGSFDYSINLPLVSSLLSRESLYKLVRRMFGTYPANKRALFGNECVMYFIRNHT
jgi:ubiquinone/menaquinone biosynthesis C-methylase UbiE